LFDNRNVFSTAKAVGRRPFDKMVTLLAYLGPPEYTRLAL